MGHISIVGKIGRKLSERRNIRIFAIVSIEHTCLSIEESVLF